MESASICRNNAKGVGGWMYGTKEMTHLFYLSLNNVSFKENSLKTDDYDKKNLYSFSHFWPCLIVWAECQCPDVADGLYVPSRR